VRIDILGDAALAFLYLPLQCQAEGETRPACDICRLIIQILVGWHVCASSSFRQSENPVEIGNTPKIL
jgi:hypothetical protein